MTEARQQGAVSRSGHASSVAFHQATGGVGRVGSGGTEVKSHDGAQHTVGFGGGHRPGQEVLDIVSDGVDSL
jgi:hypothetical protein